VTPNDITFTDGDAGPNTLQNYPFNLTAKNESGGTRVTGTLDSTANADFDVRVYSSPTCNASGFGEGKVPRGAFIVSTNGVGVVAFDQVIAGETTPGHFITMTVNSTTGNTSEFSECAQVSNIDVFNTNDGGGGSLRQAIALANAAAGVQTITFNLPGVGPYTIAPLTPLPAITDAVIIDGTSQPGYTDRPVVVLSGASMPADSYGLNVFAVGSTIRGLTINGFAAGPLFQAAAIHLAHGAATIESNYIGTDETGTIAVPNSRPATRSAAPLPRPATSSRATRAARASGSRTTTPT
jgi:hypothetical protein